MSPTLEIPNAPTKQIHHTVIPHVYRPNIPSILTAIASDDEICWKNSIAKVEIRDKWSVIYWEC